MALPAGTRLGPYAILGPLGAGGMGEVYRARDPRLDRDVAVKVLPEEVSRDPDRRHRFEREAKAAAALSHPHILDVHDIGEHEGRLYVVTELLEGETLRAALRKGGVTPRKAVEYATQIARGLAAAHEKGIVHRDVKPENVFVTPTGGVKLLDFGLARVTHRPVEDDASEAATASEATEPGAVLGTVGYMSPEQVRGLAADHRSDIFAFGTLLHEMLAGTHPFHGETPAETMAAILKEDAPPLTSGPAALARLVGRCLEKGPDERFQSARDLAFQLEALSADAASGVPRRRWLLAGAAVVVVAVAVAWLQRAAPPSDAAGGPPGERKKLVVLPFDNAGSPDDAYFAAGMTEEITNRLARVGGLGVISRSSALRCKRAEMTVNQIGAELGVDYILEGTVRPDPRAEGVGRVRVSARLVQTADDTHVWADSYDRVLGDFFAVQSEVAEAIVRQLGVALQPEEAEAIQERPTENLDAHRFYMAGLEHYWDPDMQKESWEIATQMFEKALELAPEFVAARAQLSQTYSLLLWEWGPSPVWHERARQSAQTILDRDPGSPLGHRALGMYYRYGLMKRERALEEFTLAAKHLPNDAELLFTLGLLQRPTPEGIAKQKSALELDPLNASMAYELGISLHTLRRYAEAERYFDRSIALAPDQAVAYEHKMWNTLSWTGSLEEARAIMESMPRKPHVSYYRGWVRLAFLSRRYDEALAILDSARKELSLETSVETGLRLSECELHEVLGPPERARACYDAASVLLEEWPDNNEVRRWAARILLGVGRKEEALRAARERAPRGGRGTFNFRDLAFVYMKTGQHERAIEELERLLSRPSRLSVWDIRLDPRWDPLRDHPRFQRLVGDAR